MSLLSKLLLFTYKERNKTLFFLSPFILLVLSWTVIFIVDSTIHVVIFWPLTIGIVYFVAWVIFMKIRFYYRIGPDGGLNKIQTIKLNDVFDKFRQEAGKYGWTIEEKIKTPIQDMGLTIKGSENGTPFTVDIAYSPTKASAVAPSAVYIPTNKGEDFEIQYDDDLHAQENTLNVRGRFILDTKSNLAWLIKEKQFITGISFKDGSMGALIQDYDGLSKNLKETVSKLAQVVKNYNTYYQ